MNVDKVIECVSCGKILDNGKYFTCPKCRRAPMCYSHRDNELKICVGCASEVRVKELNEIRSTQRGLSGFLRLVEFLFIASAILFASMRFIPDVMPDFIKDNMLVKYIYIWSVVFFVFTIILYIMVKLEDSKIETFEDKLRSFVPPRRVER